MIFFFVRLFQLQDIVTGLADLKDIISIIVNANRGNACFDVTLISRLFARSRLHPLKIGATGRILERNIVAQNTDTRCP